MCEREGEGLFRSTFATPTGRVQQNSWPASHSGIRSDKQRDRGQCCSPTAKIPAAVSEQLCRYWYFSVLEDKYITLANSLGAKCCYDAACSEAGLAEIGRAHV